MSEAKKILDKLNNDYRKLHQEYEELFWVSYMGDQSVDDRKDKALSARDAFKSDAKLLKVTQNLWSRAKGKTKERLQVWIDFFNQNQMSPEARELKFKIDSLESAIAKKRANRTEGYVNPETNEFTVASSLKMRTMMRTHSDEKVRKVCFEALEKLALDHVDDYVEIVRLRNQFAKNQGYEDFYDYKLQNEDKMTKKELFSLFDNIAEKTKSTFIEIRELAKKKPGLRKPWNFAYCMTGDFTKEEDPYFQFDQAIDRWGRSFAALGIDFNNGNLKLDLLDRKGKWGNGFCHWPKLVHFKDNKIQPGSSNFTCNVVSGQIGSGSLGYNTLFHEGGHAAHFLNCKQKDVCLNHEYAPMTAGWAETHSMFLDTMFSSIEWKMRYAKDVLGKTYPFELFEQKEKKLNILSPMRMLSIIFVCSFEREVYELKNPTADKIISIAKKNYRRYYYMTEDSVSVLGIPHLYAWDSACAYHGYGLATIALSQWREYFYKKYGYIVDNPKIGKEMRKMWELGASKDFKECIKLATGKKLSSSAVIKEITMSYETTIRRSKTRLKKMKSVRLYEKPVKLNAAISMVHGKKEISNNKISFEDMASKYAKWIRSMG